jgi:hypothetical protein
MIATIGIMVGIIGVMIGLYIVLKIIYLSGKDDSGIVFKVIGGITVVIIIGVLALAVFMVDLVKTSDTAMRSFNSYKGY